LTREVRLAVVGVGHLGRHHARIASAMRGVRCVGVLDRHDDRAGEVSRAFGVPVLRSLDEVAEQAEAVVIATPTVSHAEIAQVLIGRGCDVMIEKPIAASIAEADGILAAAREARRIVQVGHVERYNPALQAALAMAADAGVRFMQAQRLGVFTRRSLDVDVVLDLMIHDLQIAQALSSRPADDIQAVGMPVLTDKIDLANARIGFEGGFVADLTASRVSADTLREVHIFAPSMSIAVDMRAQSIRVFRLSHEAGEPGIVPAAVPVEREEPLVREMADFVRAVRDRGAPLVSGQTGRDALLLATRVQEAIERQRAAFEGAPA